MNTNPLVSVCVISFNAANTICETLDSIKKQSYTNIELIISDDCSSDNTIEVCKKWLNENESSFVSTQLLTVETNTGVTGNYNRAIRAAHGLWIKTIDGDDILCPDCVYDNITFIEDNPEAKVVFSDYSPFRVNNGEIVKLKSSFYSKTCDFSKRNSHEQFCRLLKNNILPSPTSFISAEVLKDVQFDENYPFMEDEPMWIHLTQKGYRISIFYKNTVLYRFDESLSKSRTRYYSPLLMESARRFFWGEKLNLIKEQNLQDAYDFNRKWFLLWDLVDAVLHNKKTLTHDVVFRVLRWSINTFLKYKLP